MTIEEIANEGDWTQAGDIGGCDVANCVRTAEKFAEIRNPPAVDTWYFCPEHFTEYLRMADALRERSRKEQL